MIAFLIMVARALAAAVPTVQAQPHKPYRVGVIHPGGPYAATVEGFKDELRALGLEPGKDVLLEIRDVQGNRAAISDAARSLEQAKVDLLTSVCSAISSASSSSIPRYRTVELANDAIRP